MYWLKFALFIIIVNLTCLGGHDLNMNGRKGWAYLLWAIEGAVLGYVFEKAFS